jgi:two-component system response regulator AlgR
LKLRVLLADDEPLARMRLRSLIEELGHEVCADLPDGEGVLAAVAHTHPDVVLLDVEMPGTDGVELARRLEANQPHIPVVLVTAYGQHALDAFDAAVRDYVLKPVRKERLSRALQRAATGSDKPARAAASMIRLSIGRTERLIPLDQIDCFVAEGGYVLARSATFEGFCDLRLHELVSLYGDRLVRVHRSCLAVGRAVAGMRKGEAGRHYLLFRDDLAPVVISRRQLAEVRAFLLDRVRGA